MVDQLVTKANPRDADDLSHLVLADSRAPPRPLTLPPLLPPLPAGPPPPSSSDKRPVPPTPSTCKSPASKRGCGVDGTPLVVGRGRGRRLVYPKDNWEVAPAAKKPPLEVTLDDLVRSPPPPPAHGKVGNFILSFKLSCLSSPLFPLFLLILTFSEYFAHVFYLRYELWLFIIH